MKRTSLPGTPAQIGSMASRMRSGDTRSIDGTADPVGLGLSFAGGSSINNGPGHGSQAGHSHGHSYGHGTGGSGSIGSGLSTTLGNGSAHIPIHAQHDGTGAGNEAKTIALLVGKLVNKLPCNSGVKLALVEGDAAVQATVASLRRIAASRMPWVIYALINALDTLAKVSLSELKGLAGSA